MKLKLEKILNNVGSCIQKKSWFLTVIFFSFVLVGAILIWQDCILNPHPSQSALDNILKTESEYNQKMEEIKRNNEDLDERIKKFNNPENNLQEDRSYFKKNNLDNSVDSSFNNYNPQIVN